jgi:hypothetical protein
MIILAYVIVGHSAWAAEPEQMAIDQASRILDMIGPHGIFAIIGVIIVVRAIRVLWYFEKRPLFALNIIVSSVIGALSVYFFTDLQTPKAISGGAFMTIIGSMVAYESLKWAIGFAYQHLQWDILITLYFFLSPQTVKVKGKDGEVYQVEPDEGLTTFFDKARIDKMIKRKNGTE